MSIESSKARVEALAEDTGWEAAEAQSLDGLEVVGGDGDSVATVYGNAAHLATPDDRAAFIAHAREDIPALLAVAEAAGRLLDDQDCPATSGGTEGKWCLNHDAPMVDDLKCWTVAALADALAALEALP